MYKESIKSSSPTSEKDASAEFHSYSVFKNKIFNFAMELLLVILTPKLKGNVSLIFIPTMRLLGAPMEWLFHGGVNGVQRHTKRWLYFFRQHVETRQ